MSDFCYESEFVLMGLALLDPPYGLDVCGMGGVISSLEIVD